MTATAKNHIKGLATVAMLKAQFDSGGDHLEMFMPFVIDIIASFPKDDMTTSDVREELFSHHGLVMPDHVLQTLLKRAAKKNFLRREAGRYYRIKHKIPNSNIAQDRSTAEKQHTTVAQGLRRFAEQKNQNINSDDEALELLLRFIDENHIAVIVASEKAGIIVEGPSLSRKETALVATYLKDVVVHDPTLSDYLQRMLEGFVLQNALFMNDISNAQSRFDDLSVFIDTGIILRAVGLAGDSARIATCDLFSTLKTSGSKIFVFEDTLAEVERVLRLYQEKLATPAGIRSLYPTELTRYVVANRLRPSDIAVAIGTLRTDLEHMGIKIRERPTRIPKYILNEADLTQRLMRQDNPDPTEPRVVHDVDVIAAIMTLRAGRSAASLGHARAIFATNTGLVIKRVGEWFNRNGETGIPPIVSEVALANAAWLRKPTAAAANMKVHQLVALCSAALQPSQKIWRSFVEQLRLFEESGKITSKETILAIILALTEQRFVDNDEESEVDADTLQEVIVRVRESYGKESESVRRNFEQQLAEVRAESALLKDRIQHIESRAEKSLLAEREQRITMTKQAKQRIRVFSNRIAWIIFILPLGVVSIGAILALPDFFPGNGWRRAIGWVIVVITSIFSFIDLVWSKHMWHWKELLEEKIYLYLLRYLRLS